MKKIFLLIILSYTLIDSHSQSPKRLKIGDSLPDLEFNGVWNYKSKKLRISDFRGKLLILDFWNKNCGACIKSMPRMGKLQNEYGNKLQILMVSPDTDEEINQLAKTFKNVKENKLPFINGDSILHRLFYFQTVPTHIWINESGKVLYISEGWDTNDSTLTAYFNNKNPVIAEKRENEKFSGKNVLDSFIKYAGGPGMTQYSFFMPRIEGARTSYFIKKDSIGRISDITYINDFPINMLRDAFSAPPLNFLDIRTVILKGKNSANLLSPKSEVQTTQWINEHATCYRLQLPARLSDNAYQFMQQDFTRFFDVNASIEKQKTKCLVIKCESKNKKLYSKGGSDTISTFMGDKFIMKNASIGGLVYWLNYFSNNNRRIPLFVDGTSIIQNVDIEIDKNVLIDFNIGGVNAILKSYGLVLVEEESMIDMLVISDK